MTLHPNTFLAHPGHYERLRREVRRRLARHRAWSEDGFHEALLQALQTLQAGHSPFESEEHLVSYLCISIKGYNSDEWRRNEARTARVRIRARDEADASQPPVDANLCQLDTREVVNRIFAVLPREKLRVARAACAGNSTSLTLRATEAIRKAIPSRLRQAAWSCCQQARALAGLVNKRWRSDSVLRVAPRSLMWAMTATTALLVLTTMTQAFLATATHPMAFAFVRPVGSELPRTFGRTPEQTGAGIRKAATVSNAPLPTTVAIAPPPVQRAEFRGPRVIQPIATWDSQTFSSFDLGLRGIAVWPEGALVHSYGEQDRDVSLLDYFSGRILLRSLPIDYGSSLATGRHAAYLASPRGVVYRIARHSLELTASAPTYDTGVWHCNSVTCDHLDQVHVGSSLRRSVLILDGRDLHPLGEWRSSLGLRPDVLCANGSNLFIGSIRERDSIIERFTSGPTTPVSTGQGIRLPGSIADFTARDSELYVLLSDISLLLRFYIPQSVEPGIAWPPTGKWTLRDAVGLPLRVSKLCFLPDGYMAVTCANPNTRIELFLLDH